MSLKRIAPSESLSQELQQLSKAAEFLIYTVGSSNFLDESFPREELLEISRSLSRLQFGTAEGCKTPLEYARARLPAIRRIHFRFENETEIYDDDDLDYRPVRGMSIDQSLATLISATSTALDEYRHLANAQLEDVIGDAEFDSHLASGDRSIANASLERLDVEIQNSIRDAPNVPIAVENRRDDFIRTLNDVSNVNALARSEISFQTVVAGWIHLLANELKDYPKILRKIGSGIAIGVEVAQPFREQWKRYNDKLEDVTFEEIKNVSHTFSKIADVLERKREINKRKIAHKDDSSFSSWLKSFIEDRQDGKFGIPLADVAIGIQLLLKRKPNELAKENGFKNLTAYIKSMNEFTIINGLRSTRVSTSEYTDIEEDLASNEVRIIEFISLLLDQSGSMSRKRIENELVSAFPADKLLFTERNNSLSHVISRSLMYISNGRVYGSIHVLEENDWHDDT